MKNVRSAASDVYKRQPRLDDHAERLPEDVAPGEPITYRVISVEVTLGAEAQR